MLSCKRLLYTNSIKIRENATLQQKSARIIAKFGVINTSMLSQMVKEQKEFHNVLPNIIDSLVTNPIVGGTPNAASWIKKLLYHNLTSGKNIRGLTTVLVYKMMEKPDKVTEESMRLAHTLGWCVEMLQAYLVTLDDIMDNSTTRFGMPCWYRMPDVGVDCAINDSIIMYTSLFYILRTNFSKKLNYVNMIHTVNETLFYTTMGQYSDCKLSNIKKNDYSLFTLDRYNKIAMYKAAYYSIKLPITMGLLLSNYEVRAETDRHILDISLELGILFQIQDDFIDCYGDESVTGKAASDIQEGKCTWLAVTALQRCSEAQRVIFEACYGSKEPMHVEHIKQLYDQLQLPEVYRRQESAIYENIMKRIHELPTHELRRMFREVLDIMYI